MIWDTPAQQQMPGLAPEEDEGPDLWEMLAEFGFSKLSKEDKKMARSLAFMEAGGAMMQAPDLMSGMGAAGQAFSKRYGEETAGLRAEGAQEDALRYRGLLAQAGREDAERRWQAEFGEQKRSTGATEEHRGKVLEQGAERTELAQAGLDLRRDAFDSDEEWRDYQKGQREAEKAIVAELFPEMAGLTPTSAAQLGLGDAAKNQWAGATVGGIKYDPQTGWTLDEMGPGLTERIEKNIESLQMGRDKSVFVSQLKVIEDQIEDIVKRSRGEGLPRLSREEAEQLIGPLAAEYDKRKAALIALGEIEADEDALSPEIQAIINAIPDAPLE